ncbi:MAG TPA: hypothetical protein VM307_14350, partial [Egibacteraceae bacterium]|nr:hypothetical protein [Egibacteraceae bacterium]
SPPLEDRESFLRSEGRWLLALLMLVVVGAGVIGGGWATGLLDFSQLGPRGDQPAEEGPGGDQGQAQRLDVADIDSYDPQGDGVESDSLLPNVLDNDDATTWRTEFYNTADFGGFPKDGVGIMLDLGAAQQVSAVEVDVVSDGTNLDLRVADEPSDDPADWERVARAEDASGQTRMNLDEALQTRYLLVFVVDPLPLHDGRYMAELSAVRVFGASSDGDS